MSNIFEKSILLLYDFDDPVRMGLIVKLYYDFGFRNVVLVRNEFIMSNSFFSVFSKYSRNCVQDMNYEETSKCITEEIIDYKFDGFKICAFTSFKNSKSIKNVVLPIKSCLVVGPNIGNCSCYQKLEKLIDCNLSYPKSYSKNPDEISKAISLLNGLAKSHSMLKVKNKK